ncbi:uncharacterized protein FOMMEDRAFT_155997 [Fomitiporia mediterranea MF3/22]|uniref:uncharacterized protein n=1 Tax=Fomitiporia mediterranea (strain MF3/22) TaxID=694068 RepID=UPI0004408D1A|nr:uncharacterized protein FOMMEDRAFT_155997 [Fomitiporia mediterranea MF3/22]EJD02668.1 hypothetical protein FOMMEDRAFT_155997 [Fomitiporia mediterranea MF3/22]
MQHKNDYNQSASNAKGEANTINPPSYDYVTGGSSKNQPTGPGYPRQGPYMPAPSNAQCYQPPASGGFVSAPLPSDHPEYVCMQEGRHIRSTHFGCLGVLAAIIWFPIGIACCLLDRRVVCKRCGRILDDGFSC